MPIENRERADQQKADFYKPDKVGRFGEAVRKFHTSAKTPSDYMELFRTFESCCGAWTWGEIESMIRLATNQPVECIQVTRTRDEYIEELESALIDALAGNARWYEIQHFTSLSKERCEELSNLYGRVNQSYCKKHGITD